MNNLDAKIAGLGFLQSIISRMASNSFYIKGWDLTIFIGVIALKKDVTHYGNAIFWALIVTSISFFLLDAYYLQQERIFRKVYNILSEKKFDDEGVNFFRVNPTQYKELESFETLKYTDSLFSRTILSFHIPLFVIIMAFFAMS
ncbi:MULTISPECIES: hypothetical protein [Citrobacter]|nr:MULTISPECIES: hypothetical protein [Citrobacter]AHY14035.1 hypothetical protein CFNIH1_21640 [Citrobacter freundii CFNIH1]KAA0555943.1 hypothetical protein F0329_13955 [Citrobacter werkmanii]MBD0819695.1 hypothetical protein [Citrobacter sp. C5_2]MDX7438545.1 hypothetical protein [Citrobacter cronae]HCR4014531.1 hypothetical protein [Citrobacter werkmanii]